MALEDPLHYGFHRIKNWNEGVFEAARLKAQKDFEKRLPKKEEKEVSWKSLDV